MNGRKPNMTRRDARIARQGDSRALFGSHFGTYEVDTGRQEHPELRPFFADTDPSPLGRGFLEMVDHPMRIRRPCIRSSYFLDGPGAAVQRRGADAFVEVDWDTATAFIERELRRIIARHGNTSIFAGSYGWASAGRFHHAQSQLKRFLNLIGGFVSAVNTYSYGAAAVLLPHVLGPEYADACDTSSSWDRIAGHTEIMLAFGGLRLTNAQVEAGGCGRHRVGEWLRRAGDRGMHLIVLSPQGNDVPAGIPARHIPLRPGTDTAVMLAMAHSILAGGRENGAFLERYTSGFPRFRSHVLGESDGIPKTPEWASGISGVPAPVITELADLLVTRRSYINVSWSLQRIEHGEQSYWAAIALACLSGQIGKSGGGFSFGLGSVNSVGQPIRRLRGPALSQGRNPVRDFIPVARVADMLLNPGGICDYDGRRLVFPDIRLTILPTTVI